jgi:hypothetical protein
MNPLLVNNDKIERRFFDNLVIIGEIPHVIRSIAKF